MTPRFLLDTNTLSDVIRNPQGSAAKRVRLLRQQLCTSIIVAAELRFGVVKRGARVLGERVADLLNTLDVRPFDTPADIVYGELRAELEARGRVIGPNDLLIAAHALALGVVLVTGNEREFSRVPGLNIENWLR